MMNALTKSHAGRAIPFRETGQLEEMIRAGINRHGSVQAGAAPSKEERRQTELLRFLEISAGM